MCGVGVKKKVWSFGLYPISVSFIACQGIARQCSELLGVDDDTLLPSALSWMVRCSMDDVVRLINFMRLLWIAVVLYKNVLALIQGLRVI